MHLRPRLCPRPHWGSLQCSPDCLAGWGRERERNRRGGICSGKVERMVREGAYNG